MDALILGGNSPHNREWVAQLRAAMTPLFGNIATHDYAHWASAGATIDFDHELRAVQREARMLNNYVIIAKSAGVLLSLKGIAENTLRPAKVVFLGTPLNYVRQHTMEHDFESWLRKATEPMLLVQNDHDPVASASELGRHIKTVVSPSLVTFAELPGSTHDYVDFAQLLALVQRFVVPVPPANPTS